MSKPDYLSQLVPIENKVKEKSLIDIYYDPLTLAIVNYMNAGYEISDVVAALNMTKVVKRQHPIATSLLDFTQAGLPAGVTSVVKEIRKLERSNEFLPMYIIGMHRNLEIVLSAVSTMAKFNAYPVQDYEEFLAKINASRPDKAE